MIPLPGATTVAVAAAAVCPAPDPFCAAGAGPRHPASTARTATQRMAASIAREHLERETRATVRYHEYVSPHGRRRLAPGGGTAGRRCARHLPHSRARAAARASTHLRRRDALPDHRALQPAERRGLPP